MKGVGGTPTGVSAAGASDQWRRLAALQARPVPGFNPVAPRWRRAEREATRTRSVPRGHDSAPPAHQNGECAPCWIQPAPCRESPPHPSTRSQRRHPNSHGPRTRPARAPEASGPERGSVGAGRGVERGRGAEAPKRRLAAGAVAGAGAAVGAGAPLPWRSCMRAWRCSMRAWRSLSMDATGCAGRHSGCPRLPATDRGPASSGCRTDRGSVRTARSARAGRACRPAAT